MKWLPWALLAAVGLWLAAQLHVETRLRDRLAERERSIALLRERRDSLARRLATALPLVDTLIDSLWFQTQARVESLPVDRPVPYPVYVSTVAAADTTIRACRRVLHDCTALVRTDSLLIDSLTAQTRDLRRGRPLRFLAYGASDLTGHLFAGVEGTARLPLLPITLYGRAEARVDSLTVGLRVGVAAPF